jgi:hypothetical protein
MLIVYSGRDEILVCVKAREDELLRFWFAAGAGRDVDDYDRIESTAGIVAASARMTITSH